MSDLVYQNFNNRCQGWVNPANLFFGPEIISLTAYQSPAGSNTVVSIVGANFFSYSAIRFGTFTPTVYFINSTLLSFYIPNTLYPGTYPVQVCNGSVCSNIVNYTIDMSSGYWMIDVGGNTNTISNTNPNGVQVSWLSRGVSFTVNTTSTQYNTPSNAYGIMDNQTWIICQGNGNDTYINLPSNSSYNGREITFKSITGLVFSTQQNIYPLASTTQTNIIIGGSGNANWSTLVYDNSIQKWIIMQSNW